MKINIDYRLTIPLVVCSVFFGGMIYEIRGIKNQINYELNKMSQEAHDISNECRDIADEMRDIGKDMRELSDYFAKPLH